MIKNNIVKSSLVNIDSSFRNVLPKNIYTSNNIVLPNNPLTFVKDSNTISINYPKHNLISGDKIIIQGAIGLTKTLSNSFYLINNFKYLLIFVDNNFINTNYKSYIDNLFVKIELYSTQTENNLINNIPLNNFIGIKKILVSSDISEINFINSNFSSVMTAINGSYSQTILENNCLFIELIKPYTNVSSSYVTINQIFTFSYLLISTITSII